MLAVFAVVCGGCSACHRHSRGRCERERCLSHCFNIVVFSSALGCPHTCRREDDSGPLTRGGWGAEGQGSVSCFKEAIHSTSLENMPSCIKRKTKWYATFLHGTTRSNYLSKVIFLASCGVRHVVVGPLPGVPGPRPSELELMEPWNKIKNVAKERVRRKEHEGAKLKGVRRVRRATSKLIAEGWNTTKDGVATDG